MLNEINSHPRDKYIKLNTEDHTYNVYGVTGEYTSVTTFIKQLFEEFDPEKIFNDWSDKGILVDDVYKGSNPEYINKSREEIAQMWKNKGLLASSKGTAMHTNIESYYNGLDYVDSSEEFGHFIRFANDNPHLKPYRTEWCVFHEESKICGSIDMVFFNNQTQEYEIWDWKRTKDVLSNNHYGKHSLHPKLYYLPDCKYYHYSLQLNLYKYILKTKYDIQVTKLNLVVLHPDNESYKIVECENLNKEVKLLIMERQQQFNINEKFHSVSLIFEYNNRFLLCVESRSINKEKTKFRLMYHPIGGKFEDDKDKDSFDTAIREFVEETLFDDVKEEYDLIKHSSKTIDYPIKPGMKHRFYVCNLSIIEQYNPSLFERLLNYKLDEPNDKIIELVWFDSKDKTRSYQISSLLEYFLINRLHTN